MFAILYKVTTHACLLVAGSPRWKRVHYSTNISTDIKFIPQRKNARAQKIHSWPHCQCSRRSPGMSSNALLMTANDSQKPITFTKKERKLLRMKLYNIGFVSIMCIVKGKKGLSIMHLLFCFEVQFSALSNILLHWEPFCYSSIIVKFAYDKKIKGKIKWLIIFSFSTPVLLKAYFNEE